jgi:hypothetical protein
MVAASAPAASTSEPIIIKPATADRTSVMDIPSASCRGGIHAGIARSDIDHRIDCYHGER